MSAVEQERADRQSEDAPRHDLGREQVAVGTREIGTADQRREERLGAAVEHHLAGADPDQERHQRGDGDGVGAGGQGDDAEQADTGDVGRDHQHSTVGVVDEHADGEGEHQPRREGHERRQRQQSLVVGERVGEQREGREVDPVTEVGHGGRPPLAPEPVGRGVLVALVGLTRIQGGWPFLGPRRVWRSLADRIPRVPQDTGSPNLVRTILPSVGAWHLASTSTTARGAL